MSISAINDIAQLADLETQIAMQRKKLEGEKRQRVREQIIEAARVAGFTIPELFGHKGKKTTKAVKYRHPTDSSLTWVGLGRKPLWVAEYLRNGGSMQGLEA